MEAFRKTLGSRRSDRTVKVQIGKSEEIWIEVDFQVQRISNGRLVTTSEEC